MESPIEFGRIWALTRRDISRWYTYKSQVLTTLLSGSIGVASWGINGSYRNVTVPQYDCSYVSFLIVGIVISNLILPLTQGMQSRLNPTTLESIMMAGPKAATLVLGTSLWPYTLAVIFLIPQLLIGVFLFGAVLNVNILSFVLATLISTTIVFSLAMIGTGVKIVTKMADPFTVALSIAASLLAGMTYPVSYLNNYLPGLSTIALLIPQTWIYNIMRLATLTNASIFDPAVAEAFLGALVFAVVLLPISFYVFNISIRRAKNDGTLGWQ